MLSRDTRRYSGSRRSSNLFGALTFLAVCVQIVAFVGGGSVVVEQLSRPVTVAVSGTLDRAGGGEVPEGMPPLEVRIVEDLAGDGFVGEIDPVAAEVAADAGGRWQADLIAGRAYLAFVSTGSLPAGAVARPPVAIRPVDPSPAPVAGPAWFLGVDGAAVRLEAPEPRPEVRAGETLDLTPVIHNEGQVIVTDLTVGLGTSPEVCRVAEVPVGGFAACSVRLAAPLGSTPVDLVARADSPEGPVEDSGQVLVSGAGFPAVDVGVVVRGEADGAVRLATGSALDRTVELHNTGDLPLGPVEVYDDQAGVVCVLDRLEIGQRRACRVVRDALAGSHQVAVLATAGVLDDSGSPLRDGSGQVVAPIVDSSSFGYEGVGAGVSQVERPPTEGPALSLDFVFGDARGDEADALEVLVGTEAQRTYLVRNTGDTPLANLVVADDDEGLVCTFPSLPVGATQACTLPLDVELAGLLAATATASATAVDPSGAPLLDVVAGLPEGRVVARDTASLWGVRSELVAGLSLVASPLGPEAAALVDRPVELVVDNVGDSGVTELVAVVAVVGGEGEPSLLVCESDVVGPGQQVICRGFVELPPGSSRIEVELGGAALSSRGERLGRVELASEVEARVPVAALSTRPRLLGARPDGALVVSIEVENQGPDLATDLALTLGPADPFVVGASGEGWRCGGSGCVLGRLEPGTSSGLVVVLQPESASLDLTPAIDSAVIDAAGEVVGLTVDVDRARSVTNSGPRWVPRLGSTLPTLSAYAAIIAGLLLWWRLAVARRLAARY